MALAMALVKNHRCLIENGKVYLRLFSVPQFVFGRDGWIDLEQEYADVKGLGLGDEVPGALQGKHKEWRDIERHFYIPRLAEAIVLDTDDISSINIHGRTEGIKQAESILVDKGKTHWVPTGQTELVEDPITKELFEREIYEEESLLEPLIQYPRELVWLDGAEDIPGVIILPYDDYDKVYVLEGTKENPTIRFIDDKATAGGVRPYYEKPGDGKTYIYVNGFSGGAGTQSDPYIITTAEELQAISNNLSAHYALGCDIDCSDTVNWNDGVGFEPIGSSGLRFTGSLDGKGFQISNLHIQVLSNDIGLFKYAQLATIESVYLKSVYVDGVLGVGAIIGCADSGTKIANCGASGQVFGEAHVGGLVGVSYGSTIENSWSTTNVTGEERLGYGIQFICGFIGTASSGSKISNCYAAGTVNSLPGPVPPLGFGYEDGNDNTVSSCYWDKEASGTADTGFGIGKTTAEMKQASTYVGWDFENVWGIDPDINDGYPYLRAFAQEDPPLTGGSEWSSTGSSTLYIEGTRGRQGSWSQLGEGSITTAPERGRAFAWTSDGITDLFLAPLRERVSSFQADGEGQFHIGRSSVITPIEIITLPVTNIRIIGGS